jgi:hypothetical protein
MKGKGRLLFEARGTQMRFFHTIKKVSTIQTERGLLWFHVFPAVVADDSFLGRIEIGRTQSAKGREKNELKLLKPGEDSLREGMSQSDSSSSFC